MIKSIKVCTCVAKLRYGCYELMLTHFSAVCIHIKYRRVIKVIFIIQLMLYHLLNIPKV